MTQNPRKKITNVQILRGIAALMVFAAHLVGAERDYGGGETLLPQFLEMGVTGVDLFFLISGFVMVYVTWPLGEGPREVPSGRFSQARTFLINRVSRIYPLYWILTIALLILYAGKLYFFDEVTPINNWVESFLLLPSNEFPIIPVGWTLVHEMYFYLVFALFLLIPYRYIPAAIVVWGAIIAIGYANGAQLVNAWGYVAFSPLTYEFILGAFIAWLTLRGVKSYAHAVGLIGLIWLACLLVPLAGQLYPDAVTDHGVRALIFSLPFALLLYAGVAIEWRNKITGPAWLSYLGDASYALYLIHIPVFLVIGKLMSPLAGPGLLDNIALITVFIIATIMAALCVHHFVERPLIRIARGLTR